MEQAAVNPLGAAGDSKAARVTAITHESDRHH